MSSIYKYTGVFSLGILLGLCAMYAAVHRGRTDAPIHSGLASVPSVTVPRSVRIYDKGAARAQGAISKEIEKAPDVDLLQAGKVKNTDGTTSVAAVLDNEGDVSLVTNRAFAEWMSRHEAGLGYGLVDGDLARAAQYRFTFGRLWRLYGTVQIEAFQVDRQQAAHPWNAMLYLTYRW